MGGFASLLISRMQGKKPRKMKKRKRKEKKTGLRKNGTNKKAV
jgi:hypothetical protein